MYYRRKGLYYDDMVEKIYKNVSLKSLGIRQKFYLCLKSLKRDKKVRKAKVM